MEHKKEETNKRYIFEGKIMKYNPDVLSERLEGLRIDRKDGKLSYSQLSQEIFNKTGISISHSQLNKYERFTNSETMSVNNLLALAEFYDVSIEYIIGYSETKSNDVTDKYTSEKFGLTDKSMSRLKALKEHNPFMLKFLNHFLEDDDLWKDLPSLVNDFFDINGRKENIDFERRELEIAKFSLFELCVASLNRIYEKMHIKSKKLFDIHTKKRNKNKKEEQ